MSSSSVFLSQDNSRTHDFAPPWTALESPDHDTLSGQFADEVLRGLCLGAKAIPATWRYDARGVVLAEALAMQPEHYLTRLEADILKKNRPLLRELICHSRGVVELSDARSANTFSVFSAIDKPEIYVPINRSSDVLERSVGVLRQIYPEIECLPQQADAKMPLPFSDSALREGQLVVFCPASGIANVSPLESVVFMQRLRQLVGKDGLLIVGQDMTLTTEALMGAYDDAAGIAAALNRNLLERINRELGGTFKSAGFRHEARFNIRLRRMESHLVSTTAQWVEVADRAVHFLAGESIHIENAYKYQPQEILALAQSAGWARSHLWTDTASRFAVHVFTADELHH